MMTLMPFFKQLTSEIQAIYGKSEAEAITEMLFQSLAGISRAQLIREPDLALKDEIINKLISARNRIMQHEPVQYVIGQAWFMNMQFNVNPHVLIPRPETEELVQWVIEDNCKDNIALIDIGTGSGCIAISVKKKLTGSMVTAVDKSLDALETARENARINNADIHFMQIDFLEEKNWQHLGIFDCIISNPPYIPEEERDQLEKHVKEHEPAIALFVPNADPLIFYKKIARFGEKHLSVAGNIYVEIHEPYAEDLKKIFSESGFDADVKKDMYERKRMIKATRSR